MTSNGSVSETLRGAPHVLEAADLVRDRGRCRSRVLIPLDVPEQNEPIIHEEMTWRSPDILSADDRVDTRLIVARWRGAAREEHASSGIPHDCHMVAIGAQHSEYTLRLGTRLFANHKVVPGMVQITPPAVSASIVYFQPYDNLHVFVPDSLLSECFEWRHGKRPAGRVALRDPLYEQDATLQELASTLVKIAELNDSYSRLRADFLNLAIVTHLLGRYGESSAASARTSSVLPKWRLKRAVEFIDAHLDVPVTLGDLSQAVGLSRMHFASQFRAATGVRPHEYVLRRRINRAQMMLATTNEPLAQLALSVGFGSQAHFTTVFKRFSGLTPARWRQRSLAD